MPLTTPSRTPMSPLDVEICLHNLTGNPHHRASQSIVADVRAFQVNDKVGKVPEGDLYRDVDMPTSATGKQSQVELGSPQQFPAGASRSTTATIASPSEQEFTQTATPGDSGSALQTASRPATHSARGALPLTVRQGLLRRQLRRFPPPPQESIPTLIKDAIKYLSEALKLYLMKSSKAFLQHHSDLGITLQYLGEDEFHTMPYVFVECDKALATEVKKFFAREQIQQQLRSCAHRAFPAGLRYWVHDQAPLRFGAERRTDFYSGSLSTAQLDPVCGIIIKTITDGQDWFATLGGLIEVVFEGGDVWVYGLTVSHIVPTAHEHEQVSEKSDENDKDMEDTHSDIVEAGLCDEDAELELEMTQAPIHFVIGDEAAHESEFPSRYHLYFKSTNLWLCEGFLCVPEIPRNVDLPSLDWALAEIHIHQWIIPDMLINREPRPLPAPEAPGPEDYVPPSALDYAVLRSAGLIRYGDITWGYSSLLSFPGDRAVETYLFTLRSGQSELLHLAFPDTHWCSRFSPW